MTEEAENNVNGTLDRRREERATEQFTEQYASRVNEIASCGLEIYQKQLNLGATIAHWWGDAFSTAQKATNQMISAAQSSRHAA